MFPHKSKFPLRTCVFVRQQALPWNKTIKDNDRSEPPSKYQDKSSKLYFTLNLIILVSSQLCALWLLISWASQTFPPFYVHQGDDFLWLSSACYVSIWGSFPLTSLLCKQGRALTARWPHIIITVSFGNSCLNSESWSYQYRATNGSWLR